jgi:hypothetical protein
MRIKNIKMITAFILYADKQSAQKTIESLQKSSLIKEIFLLQTVDDLPSIEGCRQIRIDAFQSSGTLRAIAQNASFELTLLYTKHTPLEMGQFAIERMSQVFADVAPGMLYADYYQQVNGENQQIPTIDYQLGSVRDDFNFGSVLLYKTKLIQDFVKSDLFASYKFAALYALRLYVSTQKSIFHLNEFLYTEEENDTRKSGEKQFDYVDPRNREVQIEMEKAFTQHLKQIGAYLKPSFKEINFDVCLFKTEASVIIPVRNRVKTIDDAIKSVLSQQTTFSFNLIIIDNYSTDGTTDLIRKYAQKDNRVVHVIPERKDLGIGGCWNEGVQNENCGKFAVQLDSDDVYASEKTLQTIVDAFYEQKAAMVIGSYTMTDFKMNPIPPGLIDHKEWTPENGRNNALRINGLGAPRAFFTPILREIRVPNTSYGEDYALGLRISRDYQIGRIYESMYLCRRWDENSDASLDISKQNAYNLYKDKLRTIEIVARKRN